MLEAYFKANALYPKTNKFVSVSSLKVYQGLPRNVGLSFLVSTKTGWFHLVDCLDLVDILAVTDQVH